MILRALVVGSSIQWSTFYDQLKGTPRTDCSANVVVLDMDTKEKYECLFPDEFATLEQMKQALGRGAPQEEIDDLADRLRGELPQEMERLTLEVLRFRGKQAAFIKLVCRMASVAAAV
jgi:hypothetical protein